jgi:Uma2 family endonuclease
LEKIIGGTFSPSTARLDRAEKMPLYASHGVKFIWLIDPDLKTLEAYKNVNGQWVYSPL